MLSYHAKFKWKITIAFHSKLKLSCLKFGFSHSHFREQENQTISNRFLRLREVVINRERKNQCRSEFVCRQKTNKPQKIEKTRRWYRSLIYSRVDNVTNTITWCSTLARKLYSEDRQGPKDKMTRSLTRNLRYSLRKMSNKNRSKWCFVFVSLEDTTETPTVAVAHNEIQVHTYLETFSVR
jgi:hypothetical protein